MLERVIGDIDVTELLTLGAYRVRRAQLRPAGPCMPLTPGSRGPTSHRLALWHATTLIREHRGDGHVAVLLGAGLDPVESLVLGGLFAGNTPFLRETRGWS